LCDLLVVFDDIAIIWQIKDLKLHSDGTYNKSETLKNLRQLVGARRQLFELKTNILLENPRRRKELFNAGNIKHIYLISVLLGETEDLGNFAEYYKKHTVHILTRNSTQIILNELDTINDFSKYFEEKEALLEKNQKIVIVGGEEELLAFYLGHDRSFAELYDATDVFIDEGAWHQLSNSKPYIEKRKENEVSFGWDSIINRTHESSPEYEKVARELARPNRFQRRVLSKVYFEAYVLADRDKIHPLYRRVFDLDGVTYCFLFADDSKPRKYRKGMIGWMCFIARGIYKPNFKVIGIATEKHSSRSCSYDFVILNMPEWNDKNQREMEEMQQKTGILLKPRVSNIHEDEYPIHFE
jgi:hypothetical protein